MSSNLTLVFMGIVAEKLVPGSKFLHIHPHEVLSSSGDITTKNKNKSSLTNMDGSALSSTVTKQNTIEAKWAGSDDITLITAPDINKGALVKVYQYLGSDQYYWKPGASEIDIAGKGSKIHYLPNTDDIDEKNTPDNGYTWGVSTVGKMARLKTTKNDGEPEEFDIELNTKKGILSVTMGSGDIIRYNAKTRTYDIKVPTVNINSSTTNILGDLNVDGNTKLKSKLTVLGKTDVKELDVSGSSNFTDTAKFNNNAKTVTKIPIE